MRTFAAFLIGFILCSSLSYAVPRVTVPGGSSGKVAEAYMADASITAQAFEANPSDCAANRYATTIAANGDLTCAQVSLTDGVSGTLPIASGGTNSTGTPTAGGIAYGTGTAYAVTTAGTGGDCLKSGGAGAPTWGSCSSISAYGTVEDEGTPLTQRTSLNFAGAGVTCADDTTKTTCTIPGSTGAPADATYITQTANGTLTNEQALSSLTTGLLLSTTGTGVVSIKAANTCTNQFPRSDTASGVWTCASVADADLASNYSGVGACAANTVATTLNDNAAPTCTALTDSYLPTVPVTKGGTGLTTVATNQVFVGTAADTVTAKTIPSCSNATTSKLLYDNATQTFSCGTDQTGGGGGLTVQSARLTADYTNATTTGTEVTGLQVSLAGAGTYLAEYYLITQSSATATGMAEGVNFTGSLTTISCVRNYPSTGGTAATGVMDDVAATLSGNIYEHNTTQSASTTAPNLGPNTGVATANANIHVRITCTIVTAAAGDLELWHRSETAATTRVMTNSYVIVTTIP